MYDEVQLRQRAEQVLAGGAATFSKHWGRYPEGIAPFGIVSGEGTHVTGTNGKTYIDTIGALGPNLLGYQHPEVTAAILHQVQQGTSFSMVHPLEIEVAEQICGYLPCAEMLRWCRNGTDATNMAVRVARAITKKEDVLFIGYAGGGGDSYGSTTDKDDGILKTIAQHNFQSSWANIPALIHTWEAHKNLACIMVEVPALEWDEPEETYIEGLRALQQLARTTGALFVLDEIVTWPRYHLHGAQWLYEVTPDLCTISKGIANGLPLAALVGKREYMAYLNRNSIFASWTFAGETTALAACQATLRACEETEALATIQALGQQFGDGIQEQLERSQLPATLYGNYARLAIKWQDLPAGIATAAELRTLWLQEQAKRGVLYGIGVVFPNAAWNQPLLEYLLEQSLEVCDLIARAINSNTVRQQMECPVITDVLSVRA